MEALQDIPKVEAPLLTEKGEATLQKTDIFRKIMWFGFKEESTWYPLNVQRVNEILEQNRQGKKPATLNEDQLEEPVKTGPLNSDIAQLDKKFANKSRNKKKNKNKRGGQGGQGSSGRAAGGPQGSNPNQNPNRNNPNRQNQNRPNRPGGPNQNRPPRPGGGPNRPTGGPNDANPNNPKN
jgi:hypothetical protein